MIALKKKQLLANQLTQKINELREDKLRRAVSDFFRKQSNLVLAAFDEYYTDVMLLQGHIDLILAPIHELQKEYYELLLEHNRDTFHRGEAQAERLVEMAMNGQALKAKKKNVQFLHDDKDKYTQHFGTLQFSEDYLESYTFTASERTMSRVDHEINQILTDGYREGWGVRDVRNRIMQRYDQFSSWEANRIARTEMQTAHNMGMMNKYSDMGVEYHEWRAAHDLRTRRSHIDMDGEITAVGSPFSNGLLYPGDKTGRIEEWINCRCSHPPFLVPPGKMVPPGMSTFRESDLIDVSEPDVNQLLKEHTQGAVDWEQYKQVLQGKTLVQAGIAHQQTKTNYEITLTDLELLSKETGISVEQLSLLPDEKLYEMLKQYGLIY